MKSTDVPLQVVHEREATSASTAVKPFYAVQVLCPTGCMSLSVPAHISLRCCSAVAVGTTDRLDMLPHVLPVPD